MAIFEKTIQNKKFDQLLWKLENEIPASSWSAELEAGSDFKEGDARCSVRVFERYSMMGGNRLSLTLTMFQNGDSPIRLSAITAGGSQAVFFKVNTLGEESFLEDVKGLLEEILEEKYDEALEHLYVIKNTSPTYKAATELKLEIEEEIKDPAALITLNCLIKDESDESKQFKLKLKKTDLLLKLHHYKEALEWAFQMDEQYPKEEQVECRLAFSLLFSESEGDKNIDHAMALIEPYLQNSDDNEIRDILNSDMTDMDKDEKERMFMKMLSAMVSKVSKPQDHRWESMKFFYYGLCVLVKKGGTAAIRFLNEASGHAAFSPKEDIDAFGLLDMGNWLDDRGIAPIELEFITKKVFEERKNNKDGGE